MSCSAARRAARGRRRRLDRAQTSAADKAEILRAGPPRWPARSRPPPPAAGHRRRPAAAEHQQLQRNRQRRHQQLQRNQQRRHQQLQRNRQRRHQQLQRNRQPSIRGCSGTSSGGVGSWSGIGASASAAGSAAVAEVVTAADVSNQRRICLRLSGNAGDGERLPFAALPVTVTLRGQLRRKRVTPPVITSRSVSRDQ